MKWGENDRETLADAIRRIVRRWVAAAAAGQAERQSSPDPAAKAAGLGITGQSACAGGPPPSRRVVPAAWLRGTWPLYQRDAAVGIHVVPLGEYDAVVVAYRVGAGVASARVAVARN